MSNIQDVGDALKQAQIIYNPTAGREQIEQQLPRILQCLQENGYQTQTHATTGAGSAILAAKTAAEQQLDLLIAAGGDGTIHEVINGLAEGKHRPTLGLLPFGTTNDLAAALGIHRNIEESCKMFTRSVSIPVDIGKLNHNRYFVNIAAGGALTDLTYEVPSKLKTMLGQLAYYLKGLEKLPQLRASYMRIEYDGNLFEGEVMLYLIANSTSVGGFHKLAPKAAINDGLFDLIIIKKTSVLHFAALANAALRGEHLNDPDILYTQASTIKVEAQGQSKINLDGEFGGVLPAQFQNLHRHIQMIVPEQRGRI